MGTDRGGLLGDDGPVLRVGGLARVALEAVGPKECVAGVGGSQAGRGQWEEEGQDGKMVGSHGVVRIMLTVLGLPFQSCGWLLRCIKE